MHFWGVGPIKNTSQSNSEFGLAKKSPLNPQFQCPNWPAISARNSIRMSILAPSPKNHNSPRPLLARLIVSDYLIVVCVNFGASVSTCPPRPFQNEQQSTPLKNKHSKQEQEQLNTLGSRAAKGGEVSGNKLNKNVPTPFPFPNHNRSGQKRAATHPSQKQTIPS